MKLTTKPVQTSFTEGVYPNLKLISSKTDVTANAKLPVLVLTVMLENGQMVNLSEYAPVIRADETKEAFIKRKSGLIMDRYPDFVKLIGGELDIEVDETSNDPETWSKAFEEISEAINNSPGLNDELLAMRLQLNNQGYLDIPNGRNVGRNKFLDKMIGYENLKLIQEQKQASSEPIVEFEAKNVTQHLTASNELPF